jgi:16S rRNA (cytidine1402-2'-O)-methyltransferase
VPPFSRGLLLFIVATPIGNLEDISARALRALRESDAILCEDTRHSGHLLTHFEIQKQLIPYHQFSEKKELGRILDMLREGKALSLISDAGTPCINDPGQILVQACIEEAIPFTLIPGPCSLIQGLVLSGFDTTRFQMVGFLPKNPKEMILQALYYPGTTIAFESPQRLLNTLETLVELQKERKVGVAREMTKKFEECVRGSAEDVYAHFQAHPPKGEIVLVIAEGTIPEEDVSVEDYVQLFQEYHGVSLKEAIKATAHLKGLPKNTVYQKIHYKPLT